MLHVIAAFLVAATVSQRAGLDPSVVSDLKVGQEAILYNWYPNETGLISLGRDVRAVKDLRKFGEAKDTRSILKGIDSGRIAPVFSGIRINVGEFIDPKDTPFPDELGLYGVEILEGPHRGWKGLANAMDVRPTPNLKMLKVAARPKDANRPDEADPVIKRGRTITDLDKQIYKEVSKINNDFRGKDKDDEWANAIDSILARYGIDRASGQKIMTVGAQANWPKK
jgi:hypothetical protein